MWIWPPRQVLDVQGAELQVLRGMGVLLSGPALQTAVIEVSGTELYSGQALQAEVAVFMREHGFHCVKDCACEFHCDSLFSRSPTPPPRSPTRCVSKECIARQQQLHDVVDHTSTAALLAAVEAAAAEAEVPPAQAMVVTTAPVAAPARRRASVFTEPPSPDDSGRPSFPWRVCADGACAVVSVFTGGVADEWRNLYATLRRIGLHQMAEKPV